MPFGKAGTLRTVEFLRTNYTDIDTQLNEWLYMNPMKDVIDVQYNYRSVLVIYRTKGGEQRR